MMKTIVGAGAVLALAASPAMAETWDSFSTSANSAYMADVDSITVSAENVTSIRLAIVPLRGGAADQSHTVNVYEFRCDANEWRNPLSIEVGEDGVETGQYPDETPFERTRDGTVPAILKEIACDGVRANPPTWASIKAFIDAGRPTPASP